MKRMLRYVCWLAGLAVLAPCSRADAVKVRDFELSAPRISRGLFDLAVTPEGEVLSLIAQDSGEWRLYRIRNWVAGPPAQDMLLLPGFFSKKDRNGLTGLDARILVANGGRYAVCTASAQWVTGFGVRSGPDLSDDVISVVDLQSFHVVSSVRTFRFGIMGVHRISLDLRGMVTVAGLTATHRGAFVRFEVPTLQNGPKCDYFWKTDPKAPPHPEPDDANVCRQALGSLSLEDYVKGDMPTFSTPPPCEANQAEFCRLPDAFTGAAAYSPDGRFGVAERIERRNDFIGGSVISSFSYIVFSNVKKADVGTVPVSIKDSVRRVLTFSGGQDYLLIMEGGTHLSAYRLSD